MDAREFKRRAGIMTEGVDVDSVSAELARANKQELASILSKAAATSSDLYGDRVIVQALQAAIDQLGGGGLYEEETETEAIKAFFQVDEENDSEFKGIQYGNKFYDTVNANTLIHRLTGNKRLFFPRVSEDVNQDPEIQTIKKALKAKGYDLEISFKKPTVY